MFDFGNLLIADPLGLNEDKLAVAPSFTDDTKVAPLHYFRKVGETFSVTCEALGNPLPEIIWLKNGKRISSGAARYIHAGKSNVDMVVLDGTDAGLYSCMYVCHINS
jgi:hypothetical protein